MSATSILQWPETSLDGVARVRLLAKLLPNVRLVERVVEAPYERVRAALDDVETTIPKVDSIVRRVQVTERDQNLLKMRVHTTVLPPMRFTCDAADGHLIMRAPLNLYVVALGARPIDGARTLYAQFEGMPRAAGRLAAWGIGRHVANDASCFQRLFQPGNDPS